MDEIREKAEKEIEKLRSDERLATLFENPRFYSEVLAQLLYNSSNPNFKMTVEDGKLKVRTEYNAMPQQVDYNNPLRSQSEVTTYYIARKDGANNLVAVKECGSTYYNAYDTNGLDNGTFSQEYFIANPNGDITHQGNMHTSVDVVKNYPASSIKSLNQVSNLLLSENAMFSGNFIEPTINTANVSYTCSSRLPDKSGIVRTSIMERKSSSKESSDLRKEQYSVLATERPENMSIGAVIAESETYTTSAGISQQVPMTPKPINGVQFSLQDTLNYYQNSFQMAIDANKQMGL
mgnify:FL=1